MSEIKISEIKVGRRIREDNGDVAELADNIREFGLIVPVIVKKTKTGYKLLAGNRRLLACSLLGQEKIQAVIR